MITEIKGEVKFCQRNIHMYNTNLLNSCIHEMSVKLQSVRKMTNLACGFGTKNQYVYEEN